MTRANLRHDAHGAQKKLHWDSALDVMELGRETVGGRRVSVGYSKIDSRQTPNCSEHFYRCDVGFGYSVSISYTMLSKT